MIIKKSAVENIRKKYREISLRLNERSRRMWAAIEAKNIGWGGITVVSEGTGIAPKTIRKGLLELGGRQYVPEDRIRRTGGGRKKLTETFSNLLERLEALVESDGCGDPESPLRWTSKSTSQLSEELKREGLRVSQRTVCSLLADLNYSLQSYKKTKGGMNHPDKDKQFRYLNERARAFQVRINPVIAVDIGKKENIGEFKRAGWVNVGIGADTAEFAVHSIRFWWDMMGKSIYPQAGELLVVVDCGVNNGCRVRPWKAGLQKLATELGLNISVCHFPPGTSRWNRIEHKMYSYISEDWRGKASAVGETVVRLIAGSKTRLEPGMKIAVKKRLDSEVRAMLDENVYEEGVKVTDEELAAVNLVEADFHGEWNYTIMA